MLSVDVTFYWSNCFVSLLKLKLYIYLLPTRMKKGKFAVVVPLLDGNLHQKLPSSYTTETGSGWEGQLQHLGVHLQNVFHDVKDESLKGSLVQLNLKFSNYQFKKHLLFSPTSWLSVFFISWRNYLLVNSSWTWKSFSRKLAGSILT